MKKINDIIMTQLVVRTNNFKLTQEYGVVGESSSITEQDNSTFFKTKYQIEAVAYVTLNGNNLTEGKHYTVDRLNNIISISNEGSPIIYNPLLTNTILVSYYYGDSNLVIRPGDTGGTPPTDETGGTGTDTGTGGEVVDTNTHVATAYAGPDVTLTLPDNIIILEAMGNPSYPHAITSYLWTVSGNQQMLGSSTARPTLYNLVEETFTVSLAITYADDATATDSKTIKVQTAQAAQLLTPEGGMDVILTDNKSLGTLENGDVIPGGLDMLEVLELLSSELLPPVPPTLSISANNGASSLYEIGTQLALTFSNTAVLNDASGWSTILTLLENDVNIGGVNTKALTITASVQSYKFTRGYFGSILEGKEELLAGTLISNQLNYSGLYPAFYYQVDDLSFTQGDINTANVLGSGNFVVNSKNNITIDVTDEVNPKYLIVAIPSAYNTKTNWYTAETNKGIIGVVDGLISINEGVLIDSPSAKWSQVSYDFYYTNVRTSFDAPLQLLNS